jgi:hypothetical protein
MQTECHGQIVQDERLGVGKPVAERGHCAVQAKQFLPLPRLAAYRR